MTSRGYWLLALAYLLLTIGFVVSLAVYTHQADEINKTNDRLVGAAVAYCQAGIAPDKAEKAIIDALSRGIAPKHLDPICIRIAEELKRP